MINMEEIVKILSEHNAKMSGGKKNVLSPLIWAFSVVLMALLVSAHLRIDTTIVYVLIGVLCLIVVAFTVGFFYFMIKDPERLQSEKYRIEKKRLDIEARKDKGNDKNKLTTSNVGELAVVDVEVLDDSAVPSK